VVGVNLEYWAVAMGDHPNLGAHGGAQPPSGSMSCDLNYWIALSGSFAMGVGGHNMRAKTATVSAVGTYEFRARLDN